MSLHLVLDLRGEDPPSDIARWARAVKRMDPPPASVSVFRVSESIAQLQNLWKQAFDEEVTVWSSDDVMSDADDMVWIMPARIVPHVDAVSQIMDARGKHPRSSTYLVKQVLKGILPDAWKQSEYLTPDNVIAEWFRTCPPEDIPLYACVTSVGRLREDERFQSPELMERFAEDGVRILHGACCRIVDKVPDRDPYSRLASVNRSASGLRRRGILPVDVISLWEETVRDRVVTETLAAFAYHMREARGVMENIDGKPDRLSGLMRRWMSRRIENKLRKYIR